MTAFIVPGDPVPQPRPRVSTRGGFARAYVPSKHPVHEYRKAIATHAEAAGLRRTGKPIDVCIVAVFARPKSHKRKTGLKADAPALPRPDVDNIAKAVLDALQGVIGDDTHVRKLVSIKAYDDENGDGYTFVEVQKTLENKDETHLEKIRSAKKPRKQARNRPVAFCNVPKGTPGEGARPMACDPPEKNTVFGQKPRLISDA